MSRILLTGSAGFIGFHAANMLLKEGHEVVGFDNLSPYYDVNLKQTRLNLLQEKAGFEFHRGDVHDQDAVTEVFKRSAPDYVLHLAAQTRLLRFQAAQARLLKETGKCVNVRLAKLR